MTTQPLPSWLTAARLVLAKHQCTYLDPDTGQQVSEKAPDALLLDVQTAHALVTVWDALQPETREVFAEMRPVRAASIAWRALAKQAA